MCVCERERERSLSLLDLPIFSLHCKFYKRRSGQAEQILEGVYSIYIVYILKGV